MPFLIKRKAVEQIDLGRVGNPLLVDSLQRPFTSHLASELCTNPIAVRPDQRVTR